MPRQDEKTENFAFTISIEYLWCVECETPAKVSTAKLPTKNFIGQNAYRNIVTNWRTMQVNKWMRIKGVNYGDTVIGAYARLIR